MSESEFECFNFRMCATATHYCSIKCNSNDFKCIQMWVVLFFDSGQRTFHLETRPSSSHSAIARVSIQLTTWVTIQDSVTQCQESILAKEDWLSWIMDSLVLVWYHMSDQGFFFTWRPGPRVPCWFVHQGPVQSPVETGWQFWNQLFVPQETVVLLVR